MLSIITPFSISVHHFTCDWAWNQVFNKLFCIKIYVKGGKCQRTGSSWIPWWHDPFLKYEMGLPGVQETPFKHVMTMCSPCDWVCRITLSTLFILYSRCQELFIVFWQYCGILSVWVQKKCATLRFCFVEVIFSRVLLLTPLGLGMPAYAMLAKGSLCEHLTRLPSFAWSRFLWTEVKLTWPSLWPSW